MTYLAFLALCAGFVLLLSVISALAVGQALHHSRSLDAQIEPNPADAKPSEFQSPRPMHHA
ncbi:hypothetical protein [Pseudomonas mangiferae]|uniref:Uncharacterized protein n=1 Tax=Pseudomonas mangiferae TaxID=2593654 RepID=A0A553GYG0_9PSED|nr:hypothetical protein [Pseudomonas mangiferae]TRX74530.1 hypothetical protein FM069_10995 [Pseudomonas mangiferae]